MTILISEQKEEEKPFKHIARIFQTGNSFAVRLPHPIAVRHGLDRPGYALVEATERGVLVKHLKEENLI